MKQTRLEALKLAVSVADADTAVELADKFADFIENGYTKKAVRKRRKRTSAQEKDNDAGTA